MRKNKKNKQKKRIVDSVAFWTTASFVLAFLAVIYAAFQIQTYEKGIMEIYANQQDAYVQLVLDQINLKKDVSSEDDIMEIIGTLDASVNKFWTLSSKDSLIFVKDVTETNKYRGFTTETYFVSDTAQKFIDELNINRVVHAYIDIKERQYIASGVRFEYAESLYQICLLTNVETVLDQNQYLSAKIDLSLMIGIVMSVFLLTVIGIGRVVARRGRELKREQDTVTMLNRMVEDLNEMLANGDLYDSRLAIFDNRYLGMMIEKIKDRNIEEVVYAVLKYDSKEAKDFFLKDSYLALDTNIIRFANETKDSVILVGVGYNEKKMKKAISFILSKHLWLDEMITSERAAGLATEKLVKQLTGEDEDEKQTIS